MKLGRLYLLPLLMLACAAQSQLPASVTNTPWPDISYYPVGEVVQTVNVRNEPDGGGKPSWVVESPLRPGNMIEQYQCRQIGYNTWVRHSLGWSLARDENMTYIEGICK